MFWSFREILELQDHSSRIFPVSLFGPAFLKAVGITL